MKIMRRNKPGSGWHAPLPGYAPVYIRADGLRVHLLGLAMAPDGRVLNGMTFPSCVERWRCIAECGGNIRRGAMVWAVRVAKRGEE